MAAVSAIWLTQNGFASNLPGTLVVSYSPSSSVTDNHHFPPDRRLIQPGAPSTTTGRKGD
jgi:hypothetical protein